MDARAHWEGIYEEKAPNVVSWFEPVPLLSLELIDEAGIDRNSAVVDIGGGESRLAAELLSRGFSDITVADISSAALGEAQRQLGDRAEEIDWVEADIRDHDFGRRFDLWHDRAVFHFMVDPSDREGYLSGMRRALVPNGQLVIATFGRDAPPTCSGLPVDRYGAGDLAALLPDFELASSRYVLHRTPGGKEQQFLYARFVRSGGAMGKPASRQA
jgi:ubiquinone/menaquinone biosynthesis C-methylase UbiE